MSEGTMQRRAERDPGVPPTPSRRWGGDRRARRLARLLAGAAVLPLTLAAAGCSSGSGDGKGESAASASATRSPSPTPTVREAAYAQLPEPCSVLSKKTLGDLVPKAGSGKESTSGENATRATCSWDSLSDNGVKGSQFRWLSVSMLRFDSDATRGEGDKLAGDYYRKQVTDAQAADGAKDLKAEEAGDTGDEATVVRYELKKKEGTFKQQTVVARTENVVITLDYNGAGLAGDKTPSADDLAKAALKAAQEAVASVQKANGAEDGGKSGGEGSGKGSGDGSGEGDKDGADGGSASPAQSGAASPSASATARES
ncbi:DUF3558 family protein [Streptomyces sp. SCSIO 75703]|uniref:DUF3558 family protein n=2 Tax=Streptomyces TaxID=1883 RepID=UPI000567FD77|nr:DUF3558 family protein [Streptomyces sp. NRRL F-5065]